MRRILYVLAVLALFVSPADALERGEDDVLVRVADVGAGLCCMIVLPDADGDGEPEYVIYDAGNGSTQTINKLRELIAEHERVELLVLSHSDSDHIPAVKNICDTYRLRKVLRTGSARDTDAWLEACRAIRREVAEEGCVDINLAPGTFARRATFRIGNAFIQFVVGWDKTPESFGLRDEREDAECRNAVSRFR